MAIEETVLLGVTAKNNEKIREARSQVYFQQICNN